MTTWGIDLGTTNSCISRIAGGKPEAVPIDGAAITPSVVLYRPEGVCTGREARNLELSMPERCVRSVKRRMGGRGPDYSIDGRAIPPEEVSAEILRALKSGAERETGQEVRDVVITVPAYFDDAQRRATLRAGELAGLHVLRLLNEPTSASLIYDRVGATEEADGPEIVMVYDLGGGTFDVSVLEAFGDVREVRATTGNTQLGGDDFDELLYRRFCDHLKHERGVELQPDAATRAKLQRLAEQTKIALSNSLEQRVSAEFVGVDAGGAPVHLQLTVTRSEFEELVRPLLQSTIDLARRALDEARLEGQSLSKICLVGGSTRIPLVRELLAENFDAEVHEEIDPDLAVALGAGVQAAMLAGEPLERVLVDVAAHSLGVRVMGDDDLPYGRPDSYAPVLFRNTVLPCSRSREFYTMTDQQPMIEVDVFQGEAPVCSRNRSIGTFTMELEPRPLHAPVRVEFTYDLDGVVKVTASQPGTTRERSVEMRLADKSDAPVVAQVVDSSVLRKAHVWLDELPEDDDARVELARLVESYEKASPSERDVREDALLDFMLDLDDEDEVAEDANHGG